MVTSDRLGQCTKGSRSDSSPGRPAGCSLRSLAHRPCHAHEITWSGLAKVTEGKTMQSSYSWLVFKLMILNGS